MAKSYLEEFVESPDNMRLFQQERAITDVTELICRVMKEEGYTRTMLAAKLGKSKGYVTQLLDGERNKTIRTVADVLAMLGREFYSCERPIHGTGQNDNGYGGLKVFYDPTDVRKQQQTASSPPVIRMSAGQ
jgi:hypothetical protein